MSMARDGLCPASAENAMCAGSVRAIVVLLSMTPTAIRGVTQRGRDEADRERPPRVPYSVSRLDPNIILADWNGEAPMLVFLREQTAQGVFHDTSIITGPQA